MTIAIHVAGPSAAGVENFAARWIDYCSRNGISFRQVDCHRSDIFDQLQGCSALMWHFSPDVPDRLFAKQLLASLTIGGLRVFPTPKTMWFSNDKVVQSYLLKSIAAPIPDFHVFYGRDEALAWAAHATYPIVFKLREGAGGENVSLVRTEKDAQRIIRRAFGRGFETYRRVPSLRERIRKTRSKAGLFEAILKGSFRLIVPPRYSAVAGRHRDYVYFQEFVAGNDHDIRIVVIGSRAFALKRGVRRGDFRASGSGIWNHDKDEFKLATIETAFRVAKRLGSQCVAFDFIHRNDEPLVVEIDFGFTPSGYDKCPGYWGDDLVWNEGDFDPYGWMVEEVLAL